MEKKKEASLKKQKRKSEKIRKTKEILQKAVRYLAEGILRVGDAFWDLLAGEKEKKKKGKKVVSVLLFFTFLFFFSAVIGLAKFPLGIYPAGFALLSALGGWGKFDRKDAFSKDRETLEMAAILTSFAGVMLSTAFMEKNGFFYLLTYLILFLARAGLTGGKLNEAPLARVTFSSVSAVGLGLLLAFFEGFPIREAFGAISLGIITPLLTYLLCGFYIFTEEGGKQGTLYTQKKVYLEGAFFTLIYLFLFALREVTLFGFSLPFVLATLLTLSLAKTKGALFGAAGGMIGGMAVANTVVAPALAVAGFFAGLFFEYSSYVALMVSFVASCGYCIYTDGLESFGYLTADFVLAAILFFPLQLLFPKEKTEKKKALVRDPSYKESVRHARQKLKNMSEAFSSLSEVFYTVSDTIKKPKYSEALRLVSDCCSEHCSRCSLAGVCWGEEQSRSVESASFAANKLLSEGSITREDFSEPFRTRCISLNQLVDLVNRRFGELNGSFLKNNKTRLLAGEYSSVSRLLKSTAGELNKELAYNPALEARAAKILKEMGIEYRRAAVFGERDLRIEVYGVFLDRIRLSSEKIIASFEKEFRCLFDAPSFFMMEESVVMRLRRKRVLSLECAKNGCTKKGESVSGDHASFFETDENYFYTLICDGMGSGREAAFTSRLASIFIEKLMHCATPKSVTLEMLNTFLMSKTDETFTTVDLLEIDLLSGEANFIKAGAAPSYILRGDRLHRIESLTPPAGILGRMCAEQTAFTLKEGDFVILLSDGVESGEEGFFPKQLSGRTFDSAAALCDHLFSAAKEKGPSRDDMSISVLRIMNSK